LALVVDAGGLAVFAEVIGAELALTANRIALVNGAVVGTRVRASGLRLKETLTISGITSSGGSVGGGNDVAGIGRSASLGDGLRAQSSSGITLSVVDHALISSNRASDIDGNATTVSGGISSESLTVWWSL